jgi:hypothetical protein
MGEHASQVQSVLRERLAESCPTFDRRAEYDLGGTPVDVAGVSDATLVFVELEWRRADPVDNTATLFRNFAASADGSVLSTARTVVVQLFTASYDLARDGVSSKRKNAEFVGNRIVASFPHASYHGVTLPLSPPRADGDLPDDWRDAVETAAEYVAECVHDVRSTDE